MTLIEKYTIRFQFSVLGGDLNVNLLSTKGADFITFLRNTFYLDLNNNPTISTTRNKTSMDTSLLDTSNTFKLLIISRILVTINFYLPLLNSKSESIQYCS